MPDDVDHELMDAKIAAAEARTDTKFAQVIGKFDALEGRLGTLEGRLGTLERSTAGTKMTIIVTGIAVVGVTIAVMGYGAQWFCLGFNMQDVAEKAARNAVEQVLQARPPTE